MKLYSIHRGVDNEIEFKGLRGKHFYSAAICVIVTLFLGFVLYMVGVPPFFTIVFLSLLGGGALWYVFRNNKRYGRWGDVKQRVQRYKPHFVCQYQSFGKLVSVRPFIKRT
jgi:hypothetical protein